jgi:hypothetical protein
MLWILAHNESKHFLKVLLHIYAIMDFWARRVFPTPPFPKTPTYCRLGSFPFDNNKIFTIFVKLSNSKHLKALHEASMKKIHVNLYLVHELIVSMDQLLLSMTCSQGVISFIDMLWKAIQITCVASSTFDQISISR